jgi:Tol biopolymer transport system component
MLTGTSAFGGDAVSDVLANVINGEADWRALPGETPPAMRVCVERCLQKDARQRFHDIADVRLAMDGAFDRTVEHVTSQRRSPGPLTYAGWAAAALVAIAAGAGVFPTRTSPVDLPETRFEIATPPTVSPGSVAISPDGRSVVFAGGSGQPLLLRRLESQDLKPLTGTDDGRMPFWSPDNQSVGFFAQGVLKRIDLAGGFIRTVADAPQPRGGTWNREGTIVFAPGSVGPLYRVTADGGTVRQATDLLPGQTNHRWPQFLPDGQRFLMITLGTPDVRGVHQGSLADRNVRRVSDRESGYAFMAPDHLLFARQGGLWARKLNRDYTSTEGDLVPVAPKVVLESTAIGYGAFSASATGAIAFRSASGVRQLVWLDRTGRTVATVGGDDDTEVTIGALSSDGRTAAVRRIVDGNQDIWLVDVDRGVARRLTTEPSDSAFPIVSPDGTRVIYIDDGKKDVNLMYERRADGTGNATLVLESDENTNPNDWSPDGRYLLYDSHSSQTNFDLLALPLFGDRKRFEVAKTRFAETGGRFSPDGRWVAYFSDESGRNEIYVQPFPGPGPKVQVSIGGGRWPRWRRDRSELFYIAPDNRLMVVPIAWTGGRFDAAPPRPLFTLRAEGGYEVSADGQRFLVTAVVSEASPITVILNWKPPAR